MQRLHPKQVWVLRLRALLAGAILLGAIALLDMLVVRAFPPGGVPTACAALFLLAWTMLVPGRRYRSWAYGIGSDELHLEHGVWTRIRTIVPFGRVQHIDVAQGPIERLFGIGTLILHTAGTRNSAVMLPGLGFGDAEQLRDLVRSKIRQDLA